MTDWALGAFSFLVIAELLVIAATIYLLRDVASGRGYVFVG